MYGTLLKVWKSWGVAFGHELLLLSTCIQIFRNQEQHNHST